MLSYSVCLKCNTKNGQCIGVEYMCVKFGWTSAIGYRNLGKQHRGSFYRTPCSINHSINHYFIVHPKVDLRAGQLSLPPHRNI